MKWHKNPTDENRLSKVNPGLCRECDVKNEYPPSFYAAGSGKKAWWRCGTCENVWLAEIRSRNNGNGCPRCSSGIHVSKFEMRVYSEIKQYFIDAVHGSKVGGIEIDVFIPSLSVGVEVDGNKWHQNVDRDRKKNERLERMGVNVIRIREDLPPIGSMDIIYSGSDDRDDVLKRLLIQMGVSGPLKGEREYREMMVGFRRVPAERMLSKTHHDLCLEWSEKNTPLTPSHISKGSMELAWWRCRFGHEWQARIDARVAGNGCPKCAGKTGLKVSETTFGVEWSDRNTVSPNMVSASSVDKFWWYCERHRLHYEKAPHERNYAGAGCPLCSGHKPSLDNSLASCLVVASRWDYDRNGTLRPEDLKKGSGKKVWLKKKDGSSSLFFAREVVKRKSDF